MQQEENRKIRKLSLLKSIYIKEKRLKSRKNGICLPTKFQ